MTEPRIELFSARFVHQEEQDHLALLVFADDDFDPENYLMLQRTFETGEEPAETDDEEEEGDGPGFYLELHSHAQSITEGVLSIALTRTTLKVKLAPEASEAIGASEIHVKYNEAKVHNTTMRQLLARIAGDIPIV